MRTAGTLLAALVLLVCAYLLGGAHQSRRQVKISDAERLATCEVRLARAHDQIEDATGITTEGNRQVDFLKASNQVLVDVIKEHVCQAPEGTP